MGLCNLNLLIKTFERARVEICTEFGLRTYIYCSHWLESSKVKCFISLIDLKILLAISWGKPWLSLCRHVEYAWHARRWGVGWGWGDVGESPLCWHLHPELFPETVGAADLTVQLHSGSPLIHLGLLPLLPRANGFLMTITFSHSAQALLPLRGITGWSTFVPPHHTGSNRNSPQSVSACGSLPIVSRTLNKNMKMLSSLSWLKC